MKYARRSPTRDNRTPRSATLLIAVATCGIVGLIFPESSTSTLPWTSAILFVVLLQNLAGTVPFPSLGFWLIAAIATTALILPVASPFLEIELFATDRSLMIYQVYTTVGIPAFLFAYCQQAGSRQAHSITGAPLTSPRNASLIASAGLLIGFLMLAVLVLYTGSIASMLQLSKFDLKIAQEGQWFNMNLPFFAVAPCLALAAALGRRKPAFLVASLIFLILAVTILFSAYRTRHLPVALTTSFLLGFLTLGPLLFPSRQGRQTHRASRSLWAHKNTIVLIGLIALSGILVRNIRSEFDRGLTSEGLTTQLERTSEKIFEGGGYFALPELTLEIIDTVPERAPYLYGQSYYRLLLAPIPRTLLPMKPINSQRIMALYLRPAARQIGTLTMPVGIIGDLYVNFGLFGVLVLAAWGHILGSIDRNTSIPFLIFSISSAVPMFHIARGSVTNPILALLVSGAIAYVINRTSFRSYQSTRTPIRSQQAGASRRGHPRFS